MGSRGWVLGGFVMKGLRAIEVTRNISTSCFGLSMAHVFQSNPPVAIYCNVRVITPILPLRLGFDVGFLVTSPKTRICAPIPSDRVAP